MQPRDRLTAKEIQIATLVWQGLTNKDIARVLITSEQVGSPTLTKLALGHNWKFA